jgi:Helix-turn-helix domain
MTDRKPTQQERILAILEQLRDGTLDVDESYIRRHPSGDGLSARYLKQVLLISEANARVSELRAKGYDIQTSEVKDKFGFAFHRLRGRKTAEQWFDSLPEQSSSLV